MYIDLFILLRSCGEQEQKGICLCCKQSFVDWGIFIELKGHEAFSQVAKLGENHNQKSKSNLFSQMVTAQSRSFHI